jgi:CcmD family protein
MRPIRIALLALALFAPAAARAQAPAGEAATAAASQTAPVAAPVSAPAEPASASASLPRDRPPRTMRAYAHVFVAFSIVWALLFGYLVYIVRKFRSVEDQVAALARS